MNELERMKQIAGLTEGDEDIKEYIDSIFREILATIDGVGGYAGTPQEALYHIGAEVETARLWIKEKF